MYRGPIIIGLLSVCAGMITLGRGGNVRGGNVRA